MSATQEMTAEVMADSRHAPREDGTPADRPTGTDISMEPLDAMEPLEPLENMNAMDDMEDMDDMEAATDPRPTWEELAERYGDTVYTMAYRLTGDPHDAADLAQDVFVRVLGNLHRYQPGTFEGWLYRITKNLFLDQVRRRTRVRMEVLDDADHAVPASSELGPADVVERGTLEARLQQGLDALSAEFRLAVVLCDVQGLSYEEIAEVTGWPIGTVRSRIHRGRRAVREHLATTAAGADDAMSRRARPAADVDPGDGVVHRDG